MAFQTLVLMTRLRVAFLLVMLTAHALTPVGVAADSAQIGLRPNILYFYVDDMGCGSIGPNGQAERREKGLPYVRTPNIDRLAAKGVNFRRGYACHVCSPSRASQQTGFHQGHAYADRNDPNNARKAIRKDDVTIGDALSEAGYVTGYWGKWGYGGSKDRENPQIDNVQTLPTSHGYQHVLAELHHVRAHTFFQPTLWKAPAPKSAIGGVHLIANSLTAMRQNAAYPSSPALQNHADYPQTAYCDDSYAFAAMDFVKQQGQNYNRTKQPFIGILAAQIPHAPFDEVAKLPKWNAAYRDDPHFEKLSPQSRQWAAMVTRIDAHFGNILKALQDPNDDGDNSDSIEKDTLVIFQSDNGGPAGKNNVELDANGGLRGNKGSIQEGGIRVPLVMKWPRMINGESALRAGTNCDRVVDITDLLPTFCELAGTVPPVGIDGVSIAPFLTGRGTQRDREFVIHESGKAASIIRGDHKLVLPKKGVPELYDLSTDHHEDDNIASQHADLTEDLKRSLIDERVLEPKGFAVTYHSWEGGEEGRLDRDANWSDYVYSNAGVTYTTASGPPTAAWIAKVQGNAPATVSVSTNTEVLALEVGGGKQPGTAHQSLFIPAKVTLAARNEVRISNRGRLDLAGGTLRCSRWVEILSGGKLSGNGTIDAHVHNGGTLRTSASTATELHIAGDFHQSATGQLATTIVGNKCIELKVDGNAVLDGVLTIATQDGVTLKKGVRYTIIAAEEIRGRFVNENDIATSPGSPSETSRFRIHYDRHQVSVEVL